MAVEYNVIERGQPGVAGGGEKKYYASAKMSGDLSMADLTKQIEKVSTVSGADIRAVLYAMVDVMTDSLANGKNVRLGELGSLRVSLSSEGRENKEDVKPSVIRSSKVLFTPGNMLKDMLKTLKYVKA